MLSNFSPNAVFWLVVFLKMPQLYPQPLYVEIFELNTGILFVRRHQSLETNTVISILQLEEMGNRK